jgi:hypothetical protein
MLRENYVHLGLEGANFLGEMLPQVFKAFTKCVVHEENKKLVIHAFVCMAMVAPGLH